MYCVVQCCAVLYIVVQCCTVLYSVIQKTVNSAHCTGCWNTIGTPVHCAVFITKQCDMHCQTVQSVVCNLRYTTTRVLHIIFLMKEYKYEYYSQKTYYTNMNIILFLTPWVMNMKRNIICKKYSQIYSKIQIYLNIWRTKLKKKFQVTATYQSEDCGYDIKTFF